MFLKQQGFSALPITTNGNLCIPVALEHVIRVTRSFSYFMVDASLSDLEARVLLGSILYSNPVPSQL
jgi:hypothetical protein